MNRYYFAIILIFSFVCKLQSQNNTTVQHFVSGSEIAVELEQDGKIFYNCTLEKGLSIYQLSKIFRTDQNQIFKQNNLRPDAPVPAGKNIVLTLAKEQIIATNKFDLGKVSHLRLMYVVKPGETLYRIAKVYFGQDINEVKQRNNLKSDQLSTGDLLLMGYWPMEKSVPVVSSTSGKGLQSLDGMTLQISDVATVEKSNGRVETAESSELPEYEWISDQAIAQWDKTNKTTKSLYVLHNHAKLGSEMELFFPLVRTTVKAKVVGRIPEGTYTEDIALYVSPKVARQLGVLDPRFRVNIKYLKQGS